MTSRQTQTAGLLALLVLIVAAAGCIDSEALNSGVGGVPVRVDVQNANTRFAGAEYTVQEIRIKPLDPQADAAQGDGPLLLISSLTRIRVDMNANPPQFVGDTPLTIGFYEVTRVELRGLEFFNGTPVDDGSCIGSITDFPSVPGPVTLVDFDDTPIIVEVQIGADNSLTLLFDGQTLLQAFEVSWECEIQRPFPFPPLKVPCVDLSAGCDPPNSPELFQVNVFSSQVNEYLSFP
jgi:hypothetical protein